MARVRRHVLRRLLIADVIGLAVAALVGPLLLSLVSSNPASAAGDSRVIYLVNLAAIPMFIGVFAVYGLYRGVTRRITYSVFSDLRNILHALMISGFLYAIVTYITRKDSHLESLTVGKVAAMCLVAMITVPVARVAAFGLLGRASVGSVPVIVVGTGKLAQTVASHLVPTPVSTSSATWTTTRSGEATSSASSRICPPCADSTAWPGWWCASPAPILSAPPKC